MTGAEPATRAAAITLDLPLLPDDGADLWRIAHAAGGLDVNSSYAYLLWCRDFAATSVIARTPDRPAGFVTGFRRPTAPEHLFVWQVAVHPDWRRRGLALAMLDDLVARDGPPVGALEATVTADNEASLRTFQRFAERHRARITTTELFAGPQFPDGHEPEVLLTIGLLH